MELRRSGGVQGDGTDRTKTQTQIFTRFGLTWHRKVHFSEILEFQGTRNGPQNLPFCPGSLQDTFIIYSLIFHQQIVFKNSSNKIEKNGNWKSENLTLELIFSSVMIEAVAFEQVSQRGMGLNFD